MPPTLHTPALTDEQTSILLAAMEATAAEANFVYGALVRAAVEGKAVSAGRLATLLDEAKAVCS